VSEEINKPDDIIAETVDVPTVQQENNKYESVSDTDACFAKKIFNRPALSHKSTTDGSLDSNYTGFGLSKPHRSDLLSHLRGFQQLCPTEEETSDSSCAPTGKFTHWNNETEVYAVSINNSNMSAVSSSENSDKVDVDSTDDGEPSSYVPSDDDRDDILRNDFMDFFRTEFAPNATSETDDNNYFPPYSEPFDIFSSIDYSIPDDRVFMFGDVVTMVTGSGPPMTVRLAGAGLRFGSTEGSNSFQVWLDKNG